MAKIYHNPTQVVPLKLPTSYYMRMGVCEKIFVGQAGVYARPALPLRSESEGEMRIK